MSFQKGHKINQGIRRGTYKGCLVCGISFYEYPYLRGKRFYCSPACANKMNKATRARRGKPIPWFIGKKPWNYIDGKSGLGDRAGDKRYWPLRRAVFVRDDYTCQLCQQKLPRKELDLDHIKGWSKYPNLRYIAKNCRTLCRPCHATTPNYKKNIKYQ